LREFGGKSGRVKWEGGKNAGKILITSPGSVCYLFFFVAFFLTAVFFLTADFFFLTAMTSLLKEKMNTFIIELF